MYNNLFGVKVNFLGNSDFSSWSDIDSYPVLRDFIMTANVNCCHTQFVGAEFQARIIAYSTAEMGCWPLHYQLDEPGHEQFQTVWTTPLYTTHGC